jgi:hypothetical protein
MRAFDFLDVETDLSDSILDIEIEERVRIVDRTLGENGDCMEWIPMRYELSDGANDPAEGAASRPGPAVRIVQLGRAIDAEPDFRLDAFEKPDPVIIDEKAVGLETVAQLQARRGPAFHQIDSRLIPTEWDRERLSRVPSDVEGQGWISMAENSVTDLAERLETHPGFRGAAWQVAVAAIDVAERGRLNDEQAWLRWGGVVGSGLG